MRTTIVVVTYNSAQRLPAFFDALPGALEGAGDVELVVADNASADDTLEIVRRRAPDATVLALPGNAGYAAGLNAAVAAARPSNAVLALNADVALHAGSLRHLLAALDLPGTGIAVPRLLDADGRLAHSLRRDPSILRALGEAVLGGTRAGRVAALGEVVVDTGRYTRAGTADWATGAAMLLSRRCLDAVGPWDESFFLYSEEVDFAQRARAAGFALRFVPEAVATHIGGDSGVSPQLWSILTVNRVRLFAARHGRLAGGAFRAAVLLNEGLRALAGRRVHRAAFTALREAPLLPPRRPHVLIVVQNLSVPFDRRVWRESQALIAAGYAVSVICPLGPGEDPYQELEGVRIHRYPPAPEARGVLGFAYEFAYCWLRTAAIALRVLAGGRVDVIQACNPPDTYFALAAPLKLLGTRFVYDQHDLCPEVYRSRFAREDGLLLRGLLTLERLTYRTADHVIATNTSYRAIALARGGKRPDEVTVVRNGPDPQRMLRAAVRPLLRRGREHLCCYLGVMGPQDGVDLVLEAARVVVQEMGREDVAFALLGFGDCEAQLREQAHRLGLDEHVTFTGRADDRMIRDYLSTADVALSPDPKDPFNDVSTMNKTMEYMAYALPVVAFDLAETRVSAQGAAVYAEANDVRAFAKAIVELLDAPERREEMGREGRARVEDTLAWSHQRAAYVGVYDRLLGR